MELNGVDSDFEPRGDLRIKCWFGSNAGIAVPKELDIEEVRAAAPYDEQIEVVLRQVGAQYPRQTMKDCSGASEMDVQSQVTKVYGVSILDASRRTFEENLVLSLLKRYPDSYGRTLANIALNGYLNHHGDEALSAAEAAREAGTSPNTAVSSAVAITGRRRVEHSISVSRLLLEKFKHSGLKNPLTEFDFKAMLSNLTAEEKKLFPEDAEPLAKAMLKRIESLPEKSVFIEFVKEASEGSPSHSTLLSAIWTTLGWEPLFSKDISTVTLVTLPWHSRIFSTIVGVSAPMDKHTKGVFCGVRNEELIGWSFGEAAFLSLIGRRPTESELFEFSMLLGLIISNGPGTISAQGAKGAVSADGPEDPLRVQINKGFVGFLSHTGFAHGGNGYEAIAFLIERFKDKGLKNPADKNHGMDLKKMADEYSRWYGSYKEEQKAISNIEYKKIPCVGHAVFKGKPVNYDPRERYVSTVFEEKGIYNVFHDFYVRLVSSLFETKVTANVFCVNVDAVIAVILLKILWEPFVKKTISEEEVERAAFTTFLFGRMAGSAAEIDDHINRGHDMDTRTPASKCVFVR
jgi:hypothetical protein